MSIRFDTDSMLGRPVKIETDMRIRFTGKGLARFRLQHTGSENGAPFAIAWIDVTILSDLKIADPRSAD